MYLKAILIGLAYGQRNAYTSFACTQCLNKLNGQYCLFKENVNQGMCCQTTETDKTQVCKNQDSADFCASNALHSNGIIR